MSITVFRKPVRHKEVSLLKLDQDPLDCSRCEDPRHNQRCVTAGEEPRRTLSIKAISTAMPPQELYVCSPAHPRRTCP